MDENDISPVDIKVNEIVTIPSNHGINEIFKEWRSDEAKEARRKKHYEVNTMKVRNESRCHMARTLPVSEVQITVRIDDIMIDHKRYPLRNRKVPVKKSARIGILKDGILEKIPWKEFIPCIGRGGAALLAKGAGYRIALGGKGRVGRPTVEWFSNSIEIETREKIKKVLEVRDRQKINRYCRNYIHQKDWGKLTKLISENGYTIRKDDKTNLLILCEKRYENIVMKIESNKMGWKKVENVDMKVKVKDCARLFFQVKSSVYKGKYENKQKMRVMVNAKPWKVSNTVKRRLKERVTGLYGKLPTVESVIAETRLRNRGDSLLQGDIDFWYGSIKRELVEKWCEKYMKTEKKYIMESLSKCIRTPIGIMKCTKGLPIGHPYSGWLATAITSEYADIPAKLEMKERKIKIAMNRYCDDHGLRIGINDNVDEIKKIVDSKYKMIGLNIEWEQRQFLNAETIPIGQDCRCSRMIERGNLDCNFICRCMRTQYIGRMKRWSAESVPLRCKVDSFIQMCNYILGFSRVNGPRNMPGTRNVLEFSRLVEILGKEKTDRKTGLKIWYNDLDSNFAPRTLKAFFKGLKKILELGKLYGWTTRKKIVSILENTLEKKKIEDQLVREGKRKKRDHRDRDTEKILFTWYSGMQFRGWRDKIREMSKICNDKDIIMWYKPGELPLRCWINGHEWYN